MYKSVALGFTAVLLCAGVALAKSSGPSTKPGRLVIMGTAAPATTDVDPATGACNFVAPGQTSSWVDGCSGTSPTSCSCYDITVSKVSGSGLKGATVTDFFVTIDNDINPATEPAVGGGPDPVCNPFLGVAVVSQESGSKVTVANLVGVSCQHVIGISKNNPTGKHDKDLLLGGWGIDSASTPADTMSGWGTLTGTVNSKDNPKKPNAISLKLSGWVTTTQ
jgi:hypothetical protein